MFIEELDLVDNLMIDGCIEASSKYLVVEKAPADQLFTYLGALRSACKTPKKMVDACPK
jgi:hypothetical protein